MDRVRGRTVVVTGGARGIGFATAKALLVRGALVVIGDRDAGALRDAVAELSRAGAVLGYPLDVADRDSFVHFLSLAKSGSDGGIDVLINNAGVMPVGSFTDQPAQAIRSALEVNLYGVLNGCQLVLPEMLARRRGHIVNIASMAGVMAIPGQVVYAATKFGVVGLSVALADEFASHGVQVTVVLPPFTRTDLIAGTKASGVGRPVEPDVVAAAIVGALDKPRTQVSVPRPARLVGPVVSMLGARGRRWFNRRIGADTLFLDDIDHAARAFYERRAQSALGVVDR
ncbi:SDR family oxidoreductase [Mycobacterium asiaticum]|uniref:SDR family oxidoreductase n=1 Tax=Mycobacterium asiaticum TaxID=1790 RepID=UPI0007EF8C66|nr:SDR family oxidoreductase [Mycobacterium asiaticum]OBI97256.1 short-chain dehydrogenase [Mycobacterium asiaticum]OBJ66742.1 short-chain dehydrogenase [Mycobacterium asiaticum]